MARRGAVLATLISTGLSGLSRLNGSARSGLAGLAGAGVGAVAQFLMVVLVTREAGQETAGAFFAATALCMMVAAILRMDAGNGLIYFIEQINATAVAEGVETMEEAEALKRLGVHCAQGYHFGRPGEAVRVIGPGGSSEQENRRGRVRVLPLAK